MLSPPPHCPRSPRCTFVTGITVELSEILQVGDDAAYGEYQLPPGRLAEEFGGVDPIDADCPAASKCIGMLTRVSPPLGLSYAYLSSSPPCPKRGVGSRELS